jgi:hypothetical protein
MLIVYLFAVATKIGDPAFFVSLEVFCYFFASRQKSKEEQSEQNFLPSRLHEKRFSLMFFLFPFCLDTATGEKSQGGANHAQRRRYSDLAVVLL